MIEIKHLNKYFNKGGSNQIHVIDDTSLILPDHGIVTFFGESGSGKTTLLNAVGGLDSYQGDIDYGDERVHNYQPSKIDDYRSKNIGYVFQNYDLLLEESVYDNLVIALDIIGIRDKEEVDKRVTYALKAVGLFKFRKKLAKALSGGQQQRVAIARALVKKCKILIADEPTGNLDSTNTIEVMNILKSISEKTLVLLVTHEKKITDFYSDFIIEIKDGRVISQRDNDTSGVMLQEEHSNAVYLKDMEQKNIDHENFCFSLYLDKSDQSKKNVTIYMKNGTIYVKSDSPVKIADSSLEIIDDHRKKITEEENKKNSLHYDNSFYDDNKKSKKSFKSFWVELKNSFSSMFGENKKKTKFLYWALFLMGIIISIATVTYSNGTLTNTSGFSYAANYDNLLDAEYMDRMGQVEKAFDEGVITKIVCPNYGNAYFNKKITYAQSISTFLNFDIFPYDDTVTLKCGTGVKKDNEIVISSDIANEIMEYFYDKANVEDLLGESVEIDSTQFDIVGISANDQDVIFQTEAQFSMTYCYMESEIQDYYVSAEIEAGHYSIVEGRDVIRKSKNPEVLISENASDYHIGDIIQNTFDGVNYSLSVVGKYQSSLYSDDSRVFITNLSKDVAAKTLPIESNDSQDTDYNEMYPYLEYRAFIVEGTKPQKFFECVANAYGSAKIGDTVLIEGDNYKVVGLFSGDTYSLNRKYLINADSYQFLCNANYCVFQASDREAAISFFNKANIKYESQYQVLYDKKVNYESQQRGIFLLLFTCLMAVSTIFIIFIMRSRILSDVYDIGIYRSLGVKRGKIIFKYLLQSMMLNLIYLMTGYIVGCFVYTAAAGIVNSVYISLLYNSVLINVLFGLIAYVVASLIGIIPICCLLMKTPAQIKSKYDI